MCANSRWWRTSLCYYCIHSVLKGWPDSQIPQNAVTSSYSSKSWVHAEQPLLWGQINIRRETLSHSCLWKTAAPSATIAKEIRNLNRRQRKGSLQDSGREQSPSAVFPGWMAKRRHPCSHGRYVHGVLLLAGRKRGKWNSSMSPSRKAALLSLTKAILVIILGFHLDNCPRDIGVPLTFSENEASFPLPCFLFHISSAQKNYLYGHPWLRNPVPGESSHWWAPTLAWPVPGDALLPPGILVKIKAVNTCKSYRNSGNLWVQVQENNSSQLLSCRAPFMSAGSRRARALQPQEGSQHRGCCPEGRAAGLPVLALPATWAVASRPRSAEGTGLLCGWRMSAFVRLRTLLGTQSAVQIFVISWQKNKKMQGTHAIALDSSVEGLFSHLECTLGMYYTCACGWVFSLHCLTTDIN